MAPSLRRIGLWILLIVPSSPGTTVAEVDPGLSGKLWVGSGWIVTGTSRAPYHGGLTGSATVLRRVAPHLSVGGELSYHRTGTAFEGLQCGPEWSVDCPAPDRRPIGVWGLGPVVRLRAGAHRFHPYALVGTGAYITEAENLAKIRRHIQPGLTAGLGVYGFLPGGLGVEGRWHTVWNGDPEQREPRLDLLSVGLGINFP